MFQTHTLKSIRTSYCTRDKCAQSLLLKNCIFSVSFLFSLLSSFLFSFLHCLIDFFLMDICKTIFKHLKGISLFFFLPRTNKIYLTSSEFLIFRKIQFFANWKNDFFSFFFLSSSECLLFRKRQFFANWKNVFFSFFSMDSFCF